MAEAEFFHDAGYPVPGHGKVWFAPTADGARLRLASWHPTVRPARGTVLIVQGRAEFIERYSETIAELRRRGFHVIAFDWRGQGGSQRFTDRPRRGHVGPYMKHQGQADSSPEAYHRSGGGEMSCGSPGSPP